jgi:hypothetical protein
VDVQEELLQRFGRMIDLPAFLGQQGFELSARQEPGCLCMTRPSSGDTLRLEKDVERGGWSYASATDPSDRGNVVDFVARHDSITRKACLDRLVACCDERAYASPEATQYRAFARDMPPDLARAVRDHERTRLEELAGSKALDRLGVAHGTLDEWRFGAVRREADVSTLMGEPKTLWGSRYRAGDKAVVVVERPIDAIAYERAHGRQAACYLATGSNPPEEERKRLAHLLAEAPEGTRVVLAFGRDDAGRRLAKEVQTLAPMTRMERHAPELGVRWADQMQMERRHALSLQRVGAARER